MCVCEPLCGPRQTQQFDVTHTVFNTNQNPKNTYFSPSLTICYNFLLDVCVSSINTEIKIKYFVRFRYSFTQKPITCFFWQVFPCDKYQLLLSQQSPDCLKSNESTKKYNFSNPKAVLLAASASMSINPVIFCSSWPPLHSNKTCFSAENNELSLDLYRTCIIFSFILILKKTNYL